MRELIALCACAGVAACELGFPSGAEPHRELNFLDMADQPKAKPQRADLVGEMPTGMMAPPAGALARDEVPYRLEQSEGDLAGMRLNPLEATPENVARGKFVYDNVCITCHGAEGAGDGHVTKLFPKPPSLMTQRVRDWPDGRIVHLPMRGQGSMPHYVSILEEWEMWAATLHIRSLQARLPVAPPAEAGTPEPADTSKGALPEPAAPAPVAEEGDQP